MAKDLTTSRINRQNILNNRYAVEEIQNAIGLKGIYYNGSYWVTKAQVADFLLRNGYMYCLGRYFTEMENISYHLAAGKISKELLQKLVHSFLENEIDFSEELKLELYESIKCDEEFND